MKGQYMERYGDGFQHRLLVTTGTLHADLLAFICVVFPLQLQGVVLSCLLHVSAKRCRLTAVSAHKATTYSPQQREKVFEGEIFGSKGGEVTAR
jgi:hypothetical protein